MKTFLSLFRGLRGKLILTYTSVTVLALLALEMLVLGGLLALNSAFSMDKRDYLNDVVYYLGPQAREFLRPGQEDLPGLQNWLEDTVASGYASVNPQDVFDSPAAVIVRDQPALVLAPGGETLAQVSDDQANLDLADSQKNLAWAWKGSIDPLTLYHVTPEGDYRLAAPVHQAGNDSPVLAVVVLTIRRLPPVRPQVISTLLAVVLATGILLLMAVVPFAALFGLIMSRGLTRRLKALTQAADAISEGDFRPLPVDRSRDEIGYLSGRMRNMAERLQALLHTQQQLVMVEERNRLARELHDTVKQQSFATLMQVRAARNLLASDPDSARQRLEEAEALLKTSQQDLGMIITELRPASLEDQGLSAALRAYLDNWSKYTRIPATLSVHNDRPLPLETEQALYRVAQEALSNVARHSSASAVSLRLACETGQVRLTTADNGLGFDPQRAASGGYGLQSMTERLASLGGSLTIESAPGSGTQITATAPLAQPKEQA